MQGSFVSYTERTEPDKNGDAARRPAKPCASMHIGGDARQAGAAADAARRPAGATTDAESYP
jgi:hypothetical protein